MNINSTFTSTRTAITVNTAQVWTSKAMAQRCGPMLMRSGKPCGIQPSTSRRVASKAAEKSTTTVRRGMSPQKEKIKIKWGGEKRERCFYASSQYAM